jgi:hypothetical protein
MRSRELQLFLRRKFKRNVPRDFAGYLALYSQNVAQIPVVTARPQMAIGSGINQLRGNADLAARAEYRPFYESVHAQFASYLSSRLAGSQVRHD